MENSQKHSVTVRYIAAWKTVKSLSEQHASFNHDKYSKRTSFCYSSGNIVFCYANQPDYSS